MHHVDGILDLEPMRMQARGGITRVGSGPDRLPLSTPPRAARLDRVRSHTLDTTARSRTLDTTAPRDDRIPRSPSPGAPPRQAWSARRAACATLALAALVACPARAATLARGPYLQNLATDRVVVVWRTDTPATCTLALREVRGGAERIVAGARGTDCAVDARGLTAGTRYAYVPRADGVALTGESVFETDDPTAPFSFLVLGDSGCGCPTQLAVRDHMLASPADFILHTGDMVYRNGEAADFDPKFFTPYGDLIRRLVFWPCLGNHDVRTASGQPWRDAFYTPANNPVGSEDHYSFDFGNAHLVVLDSNASTEPGSPQHTFLDQDLAASAAPWKFVAFHHALYSSGYHGGARKIRRSLVPLLDRHHVDLVFMGHEHHYERTWPLRGDVIVPAGEGTVYVTTGGGGHSIRPVGTSPFTAYAESAFHFTRVHVDGTTLRLEMVRSDGLIRDTMILHKPAPPRRKDP